MFIPDSRVYNFGSKFSGREQVEKYKYHVSFCFRKLVYSKKATKGCFIYILDSSNSSSFTF